MSELLNAAIENTQISWIARDPDVEAFYSNVIPRVFNELSPELRGQVVKLFGLEKASVD